MVFRKNLNKKFALISVYDKKRLRYLCSNLKNNNYNFISTGSTGKKIRSMGFKCVDISKITKFKEMLNGRVKTLNPLIYASLLYIRDLPNHRRQFLSLKVPEIDIVVVNLYPFSKFKKNISGGIVTNSDQKKYNARWIYFKKKGLFLNSNNFRNWESLPF